MLCALVGCTFESPGLGGSGVVEGTVLDLRATVSGRVVERGVSEGTLVETGQVIVRLDCRRLEAQRQQLDAEILAADADIEATAASASAAENRIAAGRLRVEAQRSELSALGAESSVAARDAKRIGQMGKYAPEAELDRTKTKAQRLRQQVEAARRTSRAAAEEVRASETEVAAVRARKTSGEHRRDALKARRTRLELDIEECTVVAPRRGFVEEIFFEEGEMAPMGAPLARIVDLDEVWVTFYLANAQLGGITRGRQAVVRADAWPGEVFTGTVTTVASQAEFTPRNIQTRDDRTRLVYPVRVNMDNPGHRLRPGMPVEVTLEVAP